MRFSVLFFLFTKLFIVLIFNFCYVAAVMMNGSTQVTRKEPLGIFVLWGFDVGLGVFCKWYL